MVQDLAHRLRNATKEQLVLLLQELVSHDSSLEAEIERLLTSFTTRVPDTDDDFSAETLVVRRSLPQQSPLPFHLDAYQQRLDAYPDRLLQGASPQDIFDDLIVLLQEAESHADQYDYQQALSIYELVIDTRLALQHTLLQRIFDRSIDEFMPVLAMLLSEASSLITSDDGLDSDNTLPPPHMDMLPISGEGRNEPSPLLPIEKRQLWLRRLFSLWLKRLDSRATEENMPDVMLEIAWGEDVPLLRSLIEKELHQRPSSVHSNIVDFSQQSRTRILEKFLRELPHT